MKELISSRKIKIDLSDYDYENDISNRLLMAELSDKERVVLEEILYSSLKTPIHNLSKNLNISEEPLKRILKKLSKTGLFELQNEIIIINKQQRKYFEFQMLKFDDDFKPDLEFIQCLLKKIPIHILPNWYSIPRTSNNIFESIIEKYLFTPHHFQRFIEEVKEKDEISNNIIHDVFTSKNHKIYAEDLKQKYNLSDIDFEKHMIYLEFSFILCLTYENVKGYWKETITPFFEWNNYLKFIRDSSPAPIKDTKKIKKPKNSDYGFIKHLQSILENIINIIPSFDEEKALILTHTNIEELSVDNDINSEFDLTKENIEEIIDKLFDLSFINIDKNKIQQTKEGKNWLSLSINEKALILYKNPLNQLPEKKYPINIFTNTNIRRAEKSILRILHSSWIYFDDFIKGVMVPLTDEQFITLKKKGKNWGYFLPQYTDVQSNLIEVVVLKWLYETAIIALGTHNNKRCLKVTDFGKNIFEI